MAFTAFFQKACRLSQDRSAHPQFLSGPAVKKRIGTTSSVQCAVQRSSYWHCMTMQLYTMFNVRSKDDPTSRFAAACTPRGTPRVGCELHKRQDCFTFSRKSHYRRSPKTDAHRPPRCKAMPLAASAPDKCSAPPAVLVPPGKNTS